ncbi:MAG TPA: sigma-70 family RNA polymerase sigma factor [Polyangium sp.]|nr:sigma-70 family RNA polymerase sigma factor [Polyangium sp.]
MTEHKAKEMRELARHVKPLHGFLVKNGVSAANAWDILQNAFINVFNRRDPLPESLEERKAILFGEVKVQMMAHFTEQRRTLERAARARELAVFMGLTEQRDMSRVLEARQLLELILLEVSPDQYEVFTDKVLDQLTLREVAQHLGMKPSTTKTHWSRALATLRAKLEDIEHRGGRKFIIFIIIAGVLGLAKNASAMFERLKRFFRPIRQAHVHNLAGMATAGIMMLSPPNSNASVNDDSSSTQHETPANALGEIRPLEIAPDSELSAKNAPAAVPSVAKAPSRVVPLSTPRRSAPKKTVKKSVPPDYLLSAAIAALRAGQPERTLVLLDQYAATDTKAANSGVVKTLRAEAQAAMLGR